MNKRKVLISGMLTLTMVLTSSLGAFASTNDSKTIHNGDMAQISDEQITAIKDARTNSINKAVENLVKDATLTQEEADNIIENLNKKPANSKTATDEDNTDKTNFAPKGNGKLRNMTDEQKEALKTEQQSLYKEALSQLVTNETITQNQADQLVEIDHGNKLELTYEQRTAINNARTNSMKQAVENLVEDGTLIQTESDDILTIPARKNSADEKKESNEEQQKSYIGPFKDFSNEQMQSLKEEIETLYDNSLAELISAGIITQEIADQVKSMPIGMSHGIGPKGGVNGFRHKGAVPSTTTTTTDSTN